MRVLAVLLMFFVLSALVIISNHGLAMAEEGNFSKFSGLYLKWLGGIYSNLRSITGYAIRLDWRVE